MNIHQKIKSEEGDKGFMYTCPAGHPTIGAGINLSVQEMPQDLRDIWLERILCANWAEISDLLIKHYGFNLYVLPDAASVVIQDMVYQMGIAGLFGFKKMLTAINEDDYELAAKELLDSKYAKQTPARANRNAELLRSVEHFGNSE